MLKDQLDTSKEVQSAQSKMINEDNIFKPMLIAKSNKHVLNALDDNKVIIERKEKVRQLDCAKKYINRSFL